MFTGFNERAIRLVANTMRLKSRGAWRFMTEALDGVGGVADTFGLGVGRDVAPHRRGVGAQRAGRAAEELGDGLSGLPPAQVPDGGVEPGHGAAEVGAWELVLALGDPIEKIVEIGAVLAERPRSDLAVQHLAADVGVIRRHLPPPLRTVLGGHPHEADELVAEALDAGDSHNASLAGARRVSLVRLHFLRFVRFSSFVTQRSVDDLPNSCASTISVEVITIMTVEIAAMVGSI